MGSQIRSEVKAMYATSRWSHRVDHMSDAQVYAIWRRNQQQQREVDNPREDEFKPVTPPGLFTPEQLYLDI